MPMAGGSTAASSRMTNANGVRVAGSMDTTITDLANFTAALVRGEGLSKAARVEMVRADLPIRSRAQFPTLGPDAPPAEQPKIAAGVGTIVFSGPQGPGLHPRRAQ